MYYLLITFGSIYKFKDKKYTPKGEVKSRYNEVSDNTFD